MTRVIKKLKVNKKRKISPRLPPKKCLFNGTDCPFEVVSAIQQSWFFWRNVVCFCGISVQVWASQHPQSMRVGRQGHSIASWWPAEAEDLDKKPNRKNNSHLLLLHFSIRANVVSNLWKKKLLPSAQDGMGFFGADSSSVESSLFWSIP